MSFLSHETGTHKNAPKHYTPEGAMSFNFDNSDVCERKHGGNENSEAAFEVAKKTTEAMREAIYIMLVRSVSGMTSKEIAAKLEKELRRDVPLHSISGRLSELKFSGYIKGAGTRRNGAEVLIAVNRNPFGSVEAQ